MVNLKREQRNEGTLAIHPLLIDHIAEKIINYAVVEKREQLYDGNLLSFRLVCRLWHGIATRQCHVQQQVEVGSYSTSVLKFRKLIRIHKTRPRSKWYSAWPSPFVNFRLCQEVFQPIYSNVLIDFFQTFQESLQSLDIWLDLRSTLAEIPFSSVSRLALLPNLKTLVYDDRRVILEGREDKRGNLLRSLVEMSPNLESLSVRFQRDYRGSVEYLSGDLLKNVQRIFNSRRFTEKLNVLKLDLHINDELLNYLKCSGIQVETLEIAIRGSTFAFTSLRQFLDSVQDFVRVLRLSYIERDSNCLVSLPRMGSLQVLEIDGTDAFSKHSVSFCDFTYKNNLPSLKTLRINIWANGHLRWTQFFQSSAIFTPVTTLTELKLPGEVSDRAMLTSVAELFPCLRKLQISVYSATLNVMQIIFERMAQLEELTVTKFSCMWDRNEKNIDDILTGFSETDCNKMWRQNLLLDQLSESDVMHLKCQPGLTNLTNLKRLSMPDLQYQASYTDITGYLAFLKMPTLKHLNVGRSHLSPTCLTELSKRFPDMEAQRRLAPAYYKEPDDDDDASFLELPGDTCVYL